MRTALYVVAGLVVVGSVHGPTTGTSSPATAAVPDGSGVPGGGAVVLLLVALGLAVFVGSARRAVGHAHGGNRARRAAHEARHVVAARAVGGRVQSAHIRGGGGMVHARGLPNARAELVFLLAGGVGDRGGCNRDDTAVRQVLREFPRGQRGAVLREATTQARRIVHQHATEVDAVAATLHHRGRL